jgi:hypothetical protein
MALSAGRGPDSQLDVADMRGQIAGAQRASKRAAARQ